MLNNSKLGVSRAHIEVGDQTLHDLLFESIRNAAYQALGKVTLQLFRERLLQLEAFRSRLKFAFKSPTRHIRADQAGVRAPRP